MASSTGQSLGAGVKGCLLGPRPEPWVPVTILPQFSVPGLGDPTLESSWAHWLHGRPLFHGHV